MGYAEVFFFVLWGFGIFRLVSWVWSFGRVFVFLNNEVLCCSSLNSYLSALLTVLGDSEAVNECCLFFFFALFNYWFALLPVQMLLQMQLIHEISNLKNLVKHAEVYNQDLEVSFYVDISVDKGLEL